MSANPPPSPPTDTPQDADERTPFMSVPSERPPSSLSQDDVMDPPEDQLRSQSAMDVASFPMGRRLSISTVPVTEEEQVLARRVHDDDMSSDGSYCYNVYSYDDEDGDEANKSFDPESFRPRRRSRYRRRKRLRERELNPTPPTLFRNDSEVAAGGLSPRVPDTSPSFLFPPYTRAKCFRLAILLFAIGVLFLIAFMPGITPSAPSARRCLGLLLFVIILWASEVIPYYATALMIPALVVVLSMLVKGHCTQVNVNDLAVPCMTSSYCASYFGASAECVFTSVPAPEAASAIMKEMGGPIIILILGVLSISEAVRKTKLDKHLSRLILSRVGSNPIVILLILMMLGALLSMWVSNITAAVIVVNLISPVLKALPSETKFSKCLLLGIAFSCNIGGSMSPMASPQNLLAQNALQSLPHVGPIVFWQWIVLAGTVGIVAVLVTWLALLLLFRPKLKRLPLPEDEAEPIGLRQIFVMCVVLVTIALWCATSAKAFKAFIGDPAVIAVIPFVLFYMSGILTKHDLQSMPWETLILMGGGMALGYAIINSRLLGVITEALQSLVGQRFYVALLAFGLLVWVFSNFISHTAAAAIIMPVMASVGDKLGHAQLLVLLTAMLDSFACALPISSFPNTLVFAERKEGDKDRYLTFNDFLLAGVLVGLLLVGLTLTLGYGLGVALKL